MGKKATFLLTEILFGVLTYICAGLAVVGWFAGIVPPQKSWFMALVALGMTPLLFVNFGIGIVWLIKKNWRAVIPFAAILLNIGYITAMLQVDLRSKDELPQSAFTVVSYNMCSHSHKDFNAALYEMLEYFDGKDVEIICFQEFDRKPDGSTDSIGMNLYPYRVAYSKYRGMQVAIFSKYLILDSQSIDFSQTSNSAMWADININDRRTRVVNVHFQTTNLNQSQREISKVKALGVDDPEGQKAFDEVMGRLSNNAALRAQQIKQVHSSFDSCTSTPVVVCGDFNDTPASFTYRQMTKKLKDSFKEGGSGYGYTFKSLFRLFRLDYVLHNDLLHSIDYESPNEGWSDHNPVLIEFCFNQ